MKLTQVPAFLSAIVLAAVIEGRVAKHVDRSLELTVIQEDPENPKYMELLEEVIHEVSLDPNSIYLHEGCGPLLILKVGHIDHGEYQEYQLTYKSRKYSQSYYPRRIHVEQKYDKLPTYLCEIKFFTTKLMDALEGLTIPEVVDWKPLTSDTWKCEPTESLRDQLNESQNT